MASSSCRFFLPFDAAGTGIDLVHSLQRTLLPRFSSLTDMVASQDGQVMRMLMVKSRRWARLPRTGAWLMEP